jgi:hypothetical protein
VLSHRVHHDAESQDVTAHDEDGEQKLANTEKLAAEYAEQNLTRIGKVLDMRVALVELSDDISCISSQNTKTDDKNKGTGALLGLQLYKLHRWDTHGARPREARVAGSDRTPNETDSAIITV